jgi:competence protein ComEA
MLRRILIGMCLVTLAGCAWFRDPPQAGITTGATVVYSGGAGGEIFSICDKGNLVYLTKSQPAVAIVKDGCNPNVNDASLAQVAALQRLADRPNPPPFAIPSPLPVHIVSPPGVSPAAAVAVAEPPRPVDPIVIQITPPQPQVQPFVCPSCPVAPPVLQPQVQVAPRSVGPPKPAGKSLVIAQLDPNTASTLDLERLPGVTAKTADAIARGRPYRSLQDLVSKKVLTESELKALSPYFVIQ